MKYYKDNPSEHLKISLDYNTRTTDNQSESRVSNMQQKTQTIIQNCSNL